MTARRKQLAFALYKEGTSIPRVLRADYIIFKRDLATAIISIQVATRSIPSRPFFSDAIRFLSDCSVIIVHHVHGEANLVIDWMAFHIIHYSNEILSIDLENAQIFFL